MNRFGLFQVYVSHIQHVIEISPFCTMYKSSVSPGFAKQIMPFLHILCYNGSLVTWTVVSLTTAKFKPLIFSMSGFTLSYTANMFILMIPHESESYVTTDGQPTSLSWNKAPFWGLRPDLYCCLTVADLLMLGALSDERMGLSFAIATGPRQRSNSRVRCCGNRVLIP
jgi:hypothetical protein